MGATSNDVIEVFEDLLKALPEEEMALLDYFEDVYI